MQKPKKKAAPQTFSVDVEDSIIQVVVTKGDSVAFAKATNGTATKVFIGGDDDVGNSLPHTHPISSTAPPGTIDVYNDKGTDATGKLLIARIRVK